jgi:hypothetical protein
VLRQKIIKYKNHAISLFYPKKKSFFDTSNICNIKYKKIKKFNYLYIDFKKLFPDLISLKVNPSDCEIESYFKSHKITRDSDLLKREFEIIKKIANSSKEISIKKSKAYLESFKKIYQQLNNEFNWTKSDFFIAPLKGGGGNHRTF